MMRVSFKSFLQHATKRSEQLERGGINFTAAVGDHKLHFDICEATAPRRGVRGFEGSKYVCDEHASMQQADPVPGIMLHTDCISFKLKINMPELVFPTSDRGKCQYKGTPNLYYVPAE